MSRNKTKSLQTNIEQTLAVLKDVPDMPETHRAAARYVYLQAAKDNIAANQTHTTPITSSRPNPWKTFVASFRTLQTKEFPVKTFITAMIIVAVILASSIGVVSASAASLPGSPLYALKTGVEDWRMNRTATPESTIGLALSFSDRRVSEVQALLAKGDAVTEQVANRYEQHLNLALQACGELEEPAKTQTRQQIAEQLASQEQAMRKAETKNAGEDQQLQNMFKAMQKTAAQVMVGEGNQYGGEGTPGEGEPAQKQNQNKAGEGNEDPGTGNPEAPGEGECDGNGLNEDPIQEQKREGPGGPNSDPGNTDAPGEGNCEDNGSSEAPNQEQQQNGPVEGECSCEGPNEDPAQVQDGSGGNERQGEVDNGNGNSGGDNAGGQNGGDDGGSNNGGNGN